jgi:hypothetical protein
LVASVLATGAIALVATSLYVPTRKSAQGKLPWAEWVAMNEWYRALVREQEEQPGFIGPPEYPDFADFPGMTLEQHWQSVQWMWIWDRAWEPPEAGRGKMHAGADEIWWSVLIVEQLLIVLLLGGTLVCVHRVARRRRAALAS